VAGYLIFLPVPFLYSVFILPAVAWLGFLGLSVPAALLERRNLLDSVRRGFALARADPVHAVGSLATLVIVSFLTATVLFVLLRGVSRIALASSAFVSLVFISPILFLGAGLLYFDQAARLESGPRSRRSRDADVHHALDPDRAGRADAEGKPRPAARGQS
jgi:amino acid transporter